MKFVRAVWKLLVGIKDALVLVFMLLFFAVLYAGLSARPEPVGEGVLALRLEGAVVEQPSNPTWAEFAGGGDIVREHRLRDLVLALRSARTDERVKAVALDLDMFTGGGQVAMADLADAVRSVRQSGKPVIAYATGYTDDSYLVASAASEIWLNPLGAVLVAGPGGQNLYFKGLLDKLGVTANIYRVGTYKAAVEPFERNDMSPEARENAQALGNALLETWRETVARNRPKARVEPYMANPVAAVAGSGGNLARAALAAGLVDKVADREQFEARLASLGGERDSAEGYKAIPLGAYVRDTVEEDAAGTIGIVTVAGNIVDGEASAGTAGGDRIASLIDEAVSEGALKALVVRVDSPGGSVMASERIRQSLLNAKRKKLPVVVSMGSVAASGGYWVATPADFIFAEPATITGSIGVFGILPSFQGSLQKLGVGADGIKTTPLSGEPDLLNGPSPEANQLIQASVNSVYGQFLSIVAQSRKKTPQEIDRIAQGRVWDGGAARQLGLVDGFGGLAEAVAKAGQLAKIEDPAAQVRYLDPARSFEEALLETLADDRALDQPRQDAFASLSPENAIRDALGQLRAILGGSTIQARCLECPAVAPARTARSDLGLLGSLRDYLFG
ncbi:MAG TPA: signal peptide peptidase SppA [Sphingomicrobium sp.]|nr:signal peptide peptidase SppA [Sphingomicrobium sp.]